MLFFLQRFMNDMGNGIEDTSDCQIPCPLNLDGSLQSVEGTWWSNKGYHRIGRMPHLFENGGCELILLHLRTFQGSTHCVEGTWWSNKGYNRI